MSLSELFPLLFPSLVPQEKKARLHWHQKPMELKIQSRMCGHSRQFSVHLKFGASPWVPWVSSPVHPFLGNPTSVTHYEVWVMILYNWDTCHPLHWSFSFCSFWFDFRSACYSQVCFQNQLLSTPRELCFIHYLAKGNGLGEVLCELFHLCRILELQVPFPHTHTPRPVPILFCTVTRLLRGRRP